MSDQERDDGFDTTERSPRRRSTAVPLSADASTAEDLGDLEETERSPRRRGGSVLPTTDTVDVDDTTELSPRRRPSALPADIGIDDTTELSPRRRSTAVPLQPDAHLDDSTRIVAGRSRAGIDDDSTQLVRPRGSTALPLATTRPSQRREVPQQAAPRPVIEEAPAPAIIRETSYGIRRAEPVHAERSAPATHAPQQVIDTAAVQGTDRRRGRRRTIIVVVAASALVVVAATALLVVLFTL